MEITRFLITGATGFIGSKIVNHLVSCGEKVYCLRRASSNLSRIKNPELINWMTLEDIREIKSISQTKIDVIIHCATNYSREEINPLDTLEVNLLLPLELLHVSRKYGARAFINLDTTLNKYVSHYSLSKHQFNDWLKKYSDNLLVINISFHNIYGPGDDGKNFASSVIKKLTMQIPIIKLTGGEQKRDFIYVDDAFDAIKSIVASIPRLPLGYHQFEVGSGHVTKLKDFISLARELSKNKITNLNFGALPYRKNEQMDVVPDISKIIELGWKPNYSLQEGISKTIEYERLKL